MICSGLQWMGVELDADRNASHCGGYEGAITKDSSPLAVYVIPTKEELLIARDTVRCVREYPKILNLAEAALRWVATLEVR